MKRVFLCGILWMSVNFVFGRHLPLVLTDSLKDFGVSRAYLGVLEDKGGKLTLEEIRNADQAFQTVPIEYLKNRQTTSAYWLTFTLCNHASSSKTWLIEFFDHNINEVQFYTPAQEGTFARSTSGNVHPFSDRFLLHKNLEFNLDLPSGQCQQYYVRIYSENKNVIVPVVRALPVFVSYALAEYSLLGIFYGILLLMAVYNLFLFIAIEKRYYLFYTCYVLAVLLFTMCQNGQGFAFLWPNHPFINRFSLELSIYGSVLFWALFTQCYVGLKARNASLYKALWVSILLRTAFLVFSLCFYSQGVRFIFVDLVPLSLAYYAMWASFPQNDKASYYFAFANTLAFTTFLITILEQYGWVGSSVFTVYSMNIGMVLEIVLLSSSLSRQMRKEIRQREEAQRALLEETRQKEQLSQKVNRELEALVRQRTAELDAANAQLALQVQQTNQMNQQLDLTNWQLKQNVSEIAQKRIVKPVADYKEFLEVYSNENACFRYLSLLKSKNVFHCKNCHGEHSGKGKEIFDRRCTKCGYNESVTANTLFHKVKFPIEKAFYMTHLVFARPELSAEELSQLLTLRKETCSVFKRKILARIHSLNKADLASWDMLILNERFEKVEVGS